MTSTSRQQAPLCVALACSLPLAVSQLQRIPSTGSSPLHGCAFSKMTHQRQAASQQQSDGFHREDGVMSSWYTYTCLTLLGWFKLQHPSIHQALVRWADALWVIAGVVVDKADGGHQHTCSCLQGLSHHHRATSGHGLLPVLVASHHRYPS